MLFLLFDFEGLALQGILHGREEKKGFAFGVPILIAT